MRSSLYLLLFCFCAFYRLSAQPQYLYDNDKHKFSVNQGWLSKDSTWGTYQKDEKTFNNDCQILTITTVRPKEYNGYLTMYRDSFVYDINKRVIKYIRILWDDSLKKWQYSATTFPVNYFYINNPIYPDSIRYMDYVGGEWKKGSYTLKKYNSNNQVTEKLDKNSFDILISKTIYEYNSNHKLVREKNENITPFFTTESVNIYNNMNLLVQASGYSGDSTNVKNFASRTVYKYDDKNRLIEESYQIRDTGNINNWVKSHILNYQNFNRANMPLLRIDEFYRPSSIFIKQRTAYAYYSDSLYKSSTTERLYGDKWENTYNNIISEYCSINTSTNEVIKKTKLLFTLYPNPISDELVIKMPKEITDIVDIEIFNITGQIVRKLKIESLENINLNISELSSGMYFLKVQTEDKTGTQKFIIQH